MFLQAETKTKIYDFFKKIKLVNENNESSKDKSAKIQQIIAYLEVVNSQIKNYSKKRELIFIDSCAGNCHLSFLIYFYYTEIENRNITIHCIDYNHRLMEKNRNLAKVIGFSKMFFHSMDILNFEFTQQPDMVYTLHACDTATDKTQLLGLKTKSKNILTVSCCQHSLKLKKQINHKCTGMTKNQTFKSKLIYMVGDSLRSLLLQMKGYKVDIIEFVSSRATDKNVMIRAKRDQVYKIEKLKEEYVNLKEIFHITPTLEKYLFDGDVVVENKMKLDSENCFSEVI